MKTEGPDLGIVLFVFNIPKIAICGDLIAKENMLLRNDVLIQRST